MRLDKGQIKRALINLFDNAVTAMSGEGTIVVNSFEDPISESVVMEVTDSGCGIDEGVHDQMFEPYFSTKQGGTGLGLAIVNRIVLDHGGSIRVMAQKPRGTKFRIEFPKTLVLPPTARKTTLESTACS